MTVPAPNPLRRSLLLGSAAALLGSQAWGAQSPQLFTSDSGFAADPDGLAQGRRVRRLAERVGVSWQPQGLPWARAQLEAQRSGGLIFPLARTPGRDGHWQWIAELGEEDCVLLVRRDALPDLNNATALRRLRVGVMRASASLEALQARGFEHIEQVPQDEINLRKLALGRLDAWAACRAATETKLTELMLNPMQIHAPLRLDRRRIYLAAALESAPRVVSAWREAARSLALA